ncbi:MULTISPECIES: SRPBCC family protein [unclassified Beijerinckia]|uniref:SRPBCC family protein n=1 Tax=unclassified Beijerinckia TaxID=2638183 RepID=UPI000894622B|nr:MULTISPECIES: SRPBCC family protein [unclassified Beijerinckia]MDH7795482.1 uncharacterized protein YndB with AHSA1/START domain [Beijerinckia sp. GAS462]SEC03362.1 Uncharacterized conserved protein YndB, AHSA1/START domain [Beijerinckia sp. 28-YEA-48]
MTTATTGIYHSTFVIERIYDATPARVFRAFADEKAKALWFGGPDDVIHSGKSFDFRPGGHETQTGLWPDGRKTEFDCRYYDIEPNQRIVYTYDMKINGERMSVSLAAIEISVEGGKTKLKLTEQGAYFDGPDGAKGREHGTNWLMDKLGASLTERLPA